MVNNLVEKTTEKPVQAVHDQAFAQSVPTRVVPALAPEEAQRRAQVAVDASIRTVIGNYLRSPPSTAECNAYWTFAQQQMRDDPDLSDNLVVLQRFAQINQSSRISELYNLTHSSQWLTVGSRSATFSASAFASSMQTLLGSTRSELVNSLALMASNPRTRSQDVSLSALGDTLAGQLATAISAQLALPRSNLPIRVSADGTTVQLASTLTPPSQSINF